MSDHHLSGSAAPTDDFSVPVRSPRSAASSTRRLLATVAAAALVAGAVGGGVWAWRAWSHQGAQPAEALPGDTLAYVSLDLDPPGGQKVAAFKTLRRFPSLKKELGLGSTDDVREAIVKQVGSDSGCDLDYGSFKPWIGERVAFAVVAQDRPEPVAVLQVGDAAKARAALKTISADCGDHGFGYVVGDDWAVLARTTSVATRVRDDSARGTLADDKEFRALTEAAGDPGLATLYAAPEAGKALLDAAEKDPFVAFSTIQLISTGFDPLTSFVSGFGVLATTRVSEDVGYGSSAEPANVSPEFRAKNRKLMKRFAHFDELSAAEQKKLMRDQEKLYAEIDPTPLPDESAGDLGQDEFPSPELSPALRKSLQDFSGLGGVARFEDGGLEVSVVGDALVGSSSDLYAGNAAGDLLTDLPDDTAVAVGVGLGDGWVDALVAQLRQQYSFGEQTDADIVASVEEATGLDLPGDLRTLGGDGISVVVGSGFSPDTLADHPEKAPVAVRLSGDDDKIEAALDKIRARIGPGGSPRLVSRRLGDDVVVGTDTAYLDHLQHGGDLTGTDRFRQVVPGAKGATTAYFVDFDAGDWLAKAVAADGGREDAEPLGAVGLTVTRHGDQQKVVFRVSFDD